MKTRRTVLTALATLPLTSTLTTAEQTTYKPLLTVTSADGTTVEFITSSALGLKDKFCAAGEDPYTDVTDPENLDNVWIKLITPLDQIKNPLSKLWATDDFNEQNLQGPFATLKEAFEVACDPLLGVAFNEAFIRPDAPLPPRIRLAD